MSKDVFLLTTRSSEVDQADRVARYSGSMFGNPDWLRSYAHAARTLLTQASESHQMKDLGLPIFYLQRHTVELALKRVIQRLIYIREAREELIVSSDREWEALLASRSTPEWFFKHDLPTLTHKAGELLRELGLSSPLPPELVLLATRIDAFEAGHADRSRYELLKPRKHEGRAPANSLPRGKETVLPLGEIQDGIEALLDGALRCSSLEDDTFLTNLAQEAECCFQALQRLGRI